MLRLTTLASVALVFSLACGLNACDSHDHADHDDHAHTEGDGHGDHDGHEHAEGVPHDHDGDGKPDHADGDHVDVNLVQASADYPLKTCVVTGDDLGDLADRIAIEHEGKQVQFCCEMCIEAFHKDPAKYLAKLETK